LRPVEVNAPNGHIILCAKKDSVLVPIAKVATYAMGKVAMYPQSELRQLQQMKQNARKLFERNPGNEQRLSHLKKLRHNYERSRSMLKSLQKVGLNDSENDINNCIPLASCGRKSYDG